MKIWGTVPGGGTANAKLLKWRQAGKKSKEANR